MRLFSILWMSLPIAITTATLTIFAAGREAIDRFNGSFAQPGETFMVLYPSLQGSGDLPLSAKEQLEKIPGVIPDKIFSFSRVPAIGPSQYVFFINGASRGWIERFSRPPYIELKPDEVRRFYDDPKSMIVTDRTLEKMGWRAGEEVTFESLGGPIKGRPTIVVPAGFAKLDKIIMHSEQLDPQLQPPFKGRTMYVNLAVDPSRFQEVRHRVEEVYAQLGTPVWTFSLEGATDYLIRSIERVTLWRRLSGLVFLCALAVLASGLAIARRNGRTHRSAMAFSVALGGGLGAGITYLRFHREGIVMGSWFLQGVTVSARAGLIGLLGAVCLGLMAVLLGTSGRRASVGG